MKIIVVNTKGGSSKSTTALQVASTYFLYKDMPVELIELDDENQDADSFKKTSIKTRQLKVGTGDGLSGTLRKNITLDDSNVVIDVGGNKTTSLFLNALKKTYLWQAIDLIMIPLSGGHQDLINAANTYELVKDFNIKVIFVLSRVRNMERIHVQYNDFFLYFPQAAKEKNTIFLTDSDVIDLSRQTQKTVYETANDAAYGEILSNKMATALKNKDNNAFQQASIHREIFEESKEYVERILVPAWKKIDEILNKDNKKGKTDE